MVCLENEFKCDVIGFPCFILVFDNLGWVGAVSFPSEEGGAIDLACTSLESPIPLDSSSCGGVFEPLFLIY